MRALGLATALLCTTAGCRWDSPAVLDVGKTCSAVAPCAGAFVCVAGLCELDSTTSGGSASTSAGSSTSINSTGSGSGTSSAAGAGSSSASASTTASSNGQTSASGGSTGTASVGTTGAVSGTTTGSAVTTGGAATTYYIAPKGLDSQDGKTQQTPFLTFAFATHLLKPGDTLYLLDGTYVEGLNGTLSAVCQGKAGAVSGTASAPITVAALNERQALVQGLGDKPTVNANLCAHWVFAGIHAQSSDNAAVTGVSTVSAYQASSITFRRLLVDHTNRYAKTGAAIALHQCQSCLVEGSEIYDYDVDGIELTAQTNGSQIRQNYLNDRHFLALDGGMSSVGIELLNASENIVENNIIEGFNGISVDVASGQDTDSGYASNNLLLGNVALAPQQGFSVNSACASQAGVQGSDCAIAGTQFSNDVALGSRVGFLFAQGIATSFSNDSAFDCGVGFLGTYSSNNGGFASSCVFENDAALTETFGFLLDRRLDLNGAVSFSDAYLSADAGISPADAGDGSNVNLPFDVDAGCLVYLPPNSPLRGQGSQGSDIGATIVDQYLDGQLTAMPLWNPDSGLFPCGAIVSGINDTDGGNCSDVNQRVAVGTSVCAAP